MTIKTKSFITLLSILTVLGLASCVSNNDPSYFYGPIYEFGNVKSMTDNTVTFTIQQRNSNGSMLVNSLEPSMVDPETYPVGTRVLVVYNITSDIPAATDGSTNVQLTDIFKAITPTIAKAPAANCNIGNVKLTLAADPYRAGRYLNIRGITVKGTYTYTCNLDEETLSTDTPHIYLAVTDSSADAVQPSTTPESRAEVEYSQCPISVDLNPVWDNLIGKGFVLHVKSGDDGAEKTFTFPPFNN